MSERHEMREIKTKLYLVKCRETNCYYVGITEDIPHRMKAHKRSAGAKFIQKYGYESYQVLEIFDTREQALKAEAAMIHKLQGENPSWIVGGIPSQWF